MLRLIRCENGRSEREDIVQKSWSLLAAAAVLLAFPLTAAAQTDLIDGVAPEDVGDSNPRIGDASNDDLSEMPISDILNEMSRRGYARYDRVERVGSLYRFYALTSDFRQVLIEVDPVARTISETPL